MKFNCTQHLISHKARGEMKTVMFGFTLVITEGISHAMDDDSNKSYSKEICKGSPLPLPLLVVYPFMVLDQKTN